MRWPYIYLAALSVWVIIWGFLAAGAEPIWVSVLALAIAVYPFVLLRLAGSGLRAQNKGEST